MHWLQFIVIGSLLSGSIILATRRRWPVILRLMCSGILIVLTFLVFTVSWNRTLGPDDPWYQTSPYQEFILFATMLLGMLARVLSAAIEKRREQLRTISPAGAQQVRLELDIWESAYPLLFSVMTFGALLTQIGDAKLGVATLVLAFQTGFFWQTVIKQP